VNRTEALIAIAYGVALIGVVVVSLLVAMTATERIPVNVETLREREKTWLVIVVVILASLLLATIFFTPYGTSGEDYDSQVAVNSFQFAFVLDPPRVPAGKIRFRISSNDVNHGFGLYNSKNHLVFQTQAIPDRTTQVVRTLRPGVYHILCLEFCGVGHDRMNGRLVVTG
jgi:cytochrome c oxidase subunit 2